VESAALRARIEEHVRGEGLIAPGGEICCLVSGGADSTCMWHALKELGYDVSAVHVNHRLRGEESEEDARFCRGLLGADVVELDGAGLSEAALREQRYSVVPDRLRATGHTASDQVETILYRLVSRGTATGIGVRRADGVVRPLLSIWRTETVQYCHLEGLPFRTDSSNADTKRGTLRDEVLPLLRRLHPAADANILRALEVRETLPPALAELLASEAGSKRVDLGGGRQVVREYNRLWLERGPVDVAGEITWGEWRISSPLEGLKVRGWRPGDRLAGRNKKIQDVFVDAKIPQSEREAWPLVVRGDEVIAVPGIVEHPQVLASKA
jgi:tRNA(Ile)-lysidine synthetase-like protein